MEEKKKEELKPASIFEKKIKPTLVYVGTIGSILMVIAYIVIVFIMVFGFSVTDLKQSFSFAMVNAVVGFIIMQLLRFQGESFAKQIPYNSTILKEYNKFKKKDPKKHSMKYYWCTSLLKDLLTKTSTTIITTTGLIYIVISGSRDYTLFLLAMVNLMMFLCFGFLALSSSYDFFCEQHIPFILEEIEELKKEHEKVNITDKDVKEALLNCKKQNKAEAVDFDTRIEN